MVSRRSLGLVASAAVLATAATVRPSAAQGSKTLLDLLNSSRDLTIFADLVKTAGVAEELQKPGRFGLFAPQNGYFNSFAAPMLTSLKADNERLKKIVLNHILIEAFAVMPGGSAEGAEMMGQLRTLGGATLNIWNGGGGIPRVQGRAIVVANVPASNGLLSAIDGLIEV